MDYMKQAVEAAIDCPQCGKKAVMSNLVRPVPNFGKTLFTTLSCRHCGFRLSDVMPAEFHEPKKYFLKVDSSKKMRARIVRSSSSTIQIPELGIEIEPGPISEGYISNIEGLLDRVEAVLKAVPKAKKQLEEVKAAKDGKKKFTVKLLDPFGNSALLGDGVKETKLSKDEIDSLKTGINVFGT